MSTDLDVDQVRQSIAYGALGFGGLAVTAPGVFTAVYGLEGDGNLRTMVRLWGTRNLVLGTLSLLTEDPAQRRTFAMLTTALNVVDTVIVLGAGSDVPVRARVGGALTTAAFAAASAYVAANL
jgi:hypothetical protein